MSLTTTEAAKILNLQPRTIRSHIERSVIAAEKKGRDYLISQEEIERFQRERRGRGKPRKEHEHATEEQCESDRIEARTHYWEERTLTEHAVPDTF